MRHRLTFCQLRQDTEKYCTCPWQGTRVLFGLCSTNAVLVGRHEQAQLSCKGRINVEAIDVERDSKRLLRGRQRLSFSAQLENQKRFSWDYKKHLAAERRKRFETFSASQSLFSCSYAGNYLLLVVLCPIITPTCLKIAVSAELPLLTSSVEQEWRSQDVKIIIINMEAYP